MDPGRVDADENTAPAPEAPARPAPDAVPSVEPLHGPMDTAEDSLDGLQTAFGALSVEEMVSQPQPVKRKRENESEKDAGGEADEGEEQGQDLTSIPTDAFPWGAGHRTLRWTHASEQAGKALRSQGHQCVVM